MKPTLLLIALAACRATPPAPVGNTTTTPASTTELLLVDQVGDSCVLKRIDPVAKTEIALASIVPERDEKHCRGARIAVSPDRMRAVLWFDAHTLHVGARTEDGRPPAGHPSDDHAIAETRRFEIDLVSHTTRDLPYIQGREYPEEIAYSRDGILRQYDSWAFDSSERGTKVTYLGRVLDFTRMEDGTPAVAMVDAWTGGAWHLEEVIETVQNPHLAEEWHATRASRTSLRSSEQLLTAHPATSKLAPDERAAIQRITPPTIDPDDPDDWAKLETSHGPLFIWMFINEDYRATTGRIAWRTNGGIEELPSLGFIPGEYVSVLPSGRFVLVAGNGSGAYPRLYDLVERRLVWSSETARATIFWPST